MIAADGRVAERLMAPVLKTGEPKGFGGSNPSLSAIHPFQVDSSVRQEPAESPADASVLLATPHLAGGEEASI